MTNGQRLFIHIDLGRVYIRPSHMPFSPFLPPFGTISILSKVFDVRKDRKAI